jgi:hypothetical protein
MLCCPTCQVEYREGFDRCADCGDPLVAAPLPAAELVDDWELLGELDSEPEALLVKGRLEAEGIACAIESLVFRAEPIPVARFSRLRLHVRADDLDRARAVLAACVAEDTTREADDGAESETPPEPEP